MEFRAQPFFYLLGALATLDFGPFFGVNHIRGKALWLNGQIGSGTCGSFKNPPSLFKVSSHFWCTMGFVGAHFFSTKFPGNLSAPIWPVSPLLKRAIFCRVLSSEGGNDPPLVWAHKRFQSARFGTFVESAQPFI